MKNTLKILALAILTLTISCNKIRYGYKYNQGSLPKTPVNLSEFNTEYDDYNSTSPILGGGFPFCFSTNRNSNGGEFDVICEPMFVRFDKTTGILDIYKNYDEVYFYKADYEIIRIGISNIKTSGNEYGPNLVITGEDPNRHFTLLYSSDISGNSQINYISNTTDEDFSEPKEVGFLNSEFEDMYPTFNSEKSKIYFCSNRNGESFNIFYIDVNPEMDIDSVLSEESVYEVYLDSSLSSSFNEKCPLIFENKMVFVSDREGGFGGFDLYYSIYENEEWSDPINLGENINSEFDEYRPILIDEGVSLTQTMMIFSSNRTGGFGGFDLYFVGIENE